MLQSVGRPRVAVLIPCYNEEVAVAQVVRDFKASLSEAVIYVYDNNSRDRTVDMAKAEGVIVRCEPASGAKAMSSAGCSRTSTRTYMFWSMEMPPITRRVRER